MKGTFWKLVCLWNKRQYILAPQNTCWAHHRKQAITAPPRACRDEDLNWQWEWKGNPRNKYNLVKIQCKQYRKRMEKGEHRMPSVKCPARAPSQCHHTITWLQDTWARTPGNVVTGDNARVAKRVKKQSGKSHQFWHHVQDDNQIFKWKCLTNSCKHGTGIWAQSELESWIFQSTT